MQHGLNKSVRSFEGEQKHPLLAFESHPAIDVKSFETTFFLNDKK